MKKVIWGTGLYANKFMLSVNKEEIDFFIDNNQEKRNRLFWGKKIVHPNDIDNWKDLYIYVPFNFYEEISAQLKKKGLKESENFSCYNEKNKISFKECIKDYEYALNTLKTKRSELYNRTLFWGISWSLDKGYKEYLKKLEECDRDLRLGLISEAVWVNAEKAEEIMGIPSVIAPKLFDIDLYIEDGKLGKLEINEIKQRPELKETFEQLKGIFADIKEESAFSMTYLINCYIEKVLEEIKPIRIITEGAANTSRRILEKRCKERGIPIVFMHAGILPGTFTFDIGGEMGKSLPALYPEKFFGLPVNEDDLEQAKRIWDYLYVSKLNRKIQPKNHCINYVMEKIEKGKPIIFFTGQLDVYSHMVPYTEETRKYYSPVFKTSLDLAIYLAEMCKKNAWNFLYKPHPMYVKPEEMNNLPDNTIYVKFGDINDLIDISDVIVSIASQTSYIGLIRNKPVMTLGYSQMRGKRCAYEVYEKKKIEETMYEALKNGFTKTQKRAFLKHIAQVLRYYVYDDLRKREIRFGKKIPSSVEEFYKLESLLKESV